VARFLAHCISDKNFPHCAVTGFPNPTFRINRLVDYIQAAGALTLIFWNIMNSSVVGYLSILTSCAEWRIRRTVSSSIWSGPVLQLLPPRMTCPGRWGRVRWFASKSSAVCRVLFLRRGYRSRPWISWPALVASPLSCGSDVRTTSPFTMEST